MIIRTGSHNFQFNLELICTSVFFEKLKLDESFQRVQFQFFEKLTSEN